MQVKNGNGPSLFCAHNVGSTFEVTKKVTIGSGGSRSVTLAFTCNTSSGGGSIIADALMTTTAETVLNRNR